MPNPSKVPRRGACIVSRRGFALRAAASLFLVLTAWSAPAEAPLPSILGFGYHAVGFQTFVARDPSRTLSVPGAARSRPIVISVWYPAGRGTGRPMRIEDYLLAEGEALKQAGLLDSRGMLEEEVFAEAIGRGAARSDLERLVAQTTVGRRDAVPEGGRAPLILWAHTNTLAKALPAEYLASHGFVVASASVVGTFERDLDVGLSGAETQARDLEVVAAELAAKKRADVSRVAIVGMSFGGISEICYTLRHPELRAIISLDGGAGSASGAAITRQSAFFDAGRLTHPILHAYQPEGADTAFFESLPYAYRVLVRFPTLRHADFSGSGLLDELAPGYLGPWSAERSAPRAALWRTVLAFLEKSMTSRARQAFSFGPSEMSVSGGEVRFLEPLPPPLRLEEARAAVQRGGMDALEAVYRDRLREDPTPISEDTCRKLGSWMLETRGRGETRRLYEIQLAMYPRSARAHYLMGVTEAGLGNRAAARTHLERTLELLSDDATLDAPARARIEKAAREALQ